MSQPTYWVGIDEAGYGPNLGPLVMTAVVARSHVDRAPQLWDDLAPHVTRAGGDPSALWVDDSKALYKPGQGRDRIEAATLALVAATNPFGQNPRALSALLDAVAAGDHNAVELERWLEGVDPPLPSSDAANERLNRVLAAQAFRNPHWEIVAIRSAVVGPSAFNQRLERPGANKAHVHFATFSRLLHQAWALAPEGHVIRVRSDKHGGRHFYLEPLINAFPDCWIDRGPEGPELSRYTVRRGTSRLELSLQPRADGDDGLVALASIVSKTLRELWMDPFNRYWAARVPGLKPTAGYPVDAARFRQEIASAAQSEGLAPELWWRSR